MKVIERLYELQELELGGVAHSSEAKQKIEAIRKDTPEPIMAHYDRLVARGKRAVAMVRHGVCGGCRMRLPSGSYAELIRDDDISMCENCGRYLLLAPEEQPQPVNPAPIPAENEPKPGDAKSKAARQPPKRKKAAGKQPATARTKS